MISIELCAVLNFEFLCETENFRIIKPAVLHATFCYSGRDPQDLLCDVPLSSMILAESNTILISPTKKTEGWHHSSVLESQKRLIHAHFFHHRSRLFHLPLTPFSRTSHTMMQSKTIIFLFALAGLTSLVAADHKKRLLRKNERDGNNVDLTEDIAFWTRMTQEVSMPAEVSFVPLVSRVFFNR